jgi:hypothetical protein
MKRFHMMYSWMTRHYRVNDIDSPLHGAIVYLHLSEKQNKFCTVQQADGWWVVLMVYRGESVWLKWTQVMEVR